MNIEVCTLNHIKIDDTFSSLDSKDRNYVVEMRMLMTKEQISKALCQISTATLTDNE